MRNEELIVAHMGLARQIATKKRRSLALHVEQADLESEALFALMKAGWRFDESRGVPFTAFVRIRIAGALEDWCSYRNQQPFGGLDEDERLDTTQLEDWRVMHDAFVKLPNRLRYVLRLRFWNGLSVYTIAPMLGISFGRVWQLERRGLKLLRESLERRGVHQVSDIL